MSRHRLKRTASSSRKKKEYSDDVEEGKVIRTDPEAGTELARGETLTVYISLGKEQKSADVPSLTGMTRRRRSVRCPSAA